LVSVEKKLSNEKFTQNAKQEILDLEYKKKADAEMKINIIENTQIPIVFYKYFSYVKQLGFIETPNYNMLRSLFITELSKNIKN